MRQQDEVIEGGEAATSYGLVRRIGPSRAALEHVIDQLRDEELGRPRPGGGWPIAGHLTHIAAWERMIVAHLTDGTDHDVVRMAPDEYENATLDQLNARIYSMHEHDAIADIRAEFRAAHEAIVECIEALRPEQLAQPYWPGEERTVAGKIAGDTYLHYDEHRAWILEIMAEGD